MMLRFGVLSIISLNMLSAHPVSPQYLQENKFAYIAQPTASYPCLSDLGGYRSYNSCQGHFLKQDSDRPFDSHDTFNGFNYAIANPILFIDRSGHAPWPIERAMRFFREKSTDSDIQTLQRAEQNGYRIGFSHGQSGRPVDPADLVPSGGPIERAMAKGYLDGLRAGRRAGPEIIHTPSMTESSLDQSTRQQSKENLAIPEEETGPVLPPEENIAPLLKDTVNPLNPTAPMKPRFNSLLTQEAETHADNFWSFLYSAPK